MKIADKTLNKLLAIFVIIDIILIICNIIIPKGSFDKTKEYMTKVDSYVNELKNNGYTDVHYEKYVYNNILSVAVYATNGENRNNLEKVYNINMDTKNELTLDEVLSIFGIDNNSFQKQYKNGYLIFFDDDNYTYLENIKNANLSEEEKNNMINEINNIKAEIEYVNYNTNVYDRFFIRNDNVYVYVDNNRWRTIRKEEFMNNENTFAYKEIVIK